MNKNKNMNDNKNMLERVLLMMKYDSGKTLTENSDVVKNEFSQILNEKGRFRAKAKPKPKLSAPKASKVSPTKITPSGLSVGDIKSQVATYAKTPLPNGKLPTPAQQVAYGKQLAAGKATPMTAPGKTAPKSTVTTTTTTTTTGGGKGGKPTTTGGRKPRKTPTPKDKSILSKLGGSIKKYPWRYGLGLGLTAGGLWWFFRDNTEVAPCLLNSLSEEEIAGLGEAGTSGAITRTQVGNRLADLNGGLIFSLDKPDVVTANGKYKGSYKCDGGALKISIAGTEITLGSTGSTDTGTSGGGGTNGGGGGGSRYKQCAETFPIAMNCKNSTIARVQGCLGITQDGAFGPNTSAALVAKGADGSSITQASVDKVCGPGAAAKIEKLTQDVDTEDLGGGNSTGVNIKSSDNSSSEDGIGG
jgi:hypothetical protein